MPQKNRRRRAAQSAMEYITTYGWAILLIAIVIGILYQLGILNFNNRDRISSGACQVYKPAIGTPGLVGACNGQLPQFVYLATPTTQFGNVITVNNIKLNNNLITFTAWVNPSASCNSNICSIVSTMYPCPVNAFYGPAGNCISADLQDYYQSPALDIYPSEMQLPVTGWWDDYCSNNFPQGKWTFVAGTYDGNTMHIYINGSECDQGGYLINQPNIVSTNTLFIGGTQTAEIDNSHFNGTIANVQVYSSPLNANEISVIYRRGLGGAPADIKDLVGGRLTATQKITVAMATTEQLAVAHSQAAIQLP